ncbi:MAG: hypothetical protein K2P70_16835 [Hyphomonadaceae bacterium]|nr:hypothetical protein [Hyphomonadaceae bacterium]
MTTKKTVAFVAVALAAAAFTAPAFAQDAEVEERVLVTGAIVDPSNAKLTVDPRDESVAEIAVVYEDEANADANESTADTNLGQSVENK